MPNRSVGTDKKSCGLEYNLPKGRGTAVILYNGIGSTINKGDAFMQELASSTEGQEMQAVACATDTLRRIIVALEDVANGSRGRFQFKGVCKEAYVNHSSALSAGEMLEVVNGDDEFNDQGGTTFTGSNEVAAMLLEAYSTADAATGNVLKKVFLHGGPVEIKSS